MKWLEGLHARVSVSLKYLSSRAGYLGFFFRSFVPMTASGLTGLRADVAANGVIPANTNGKTIVFFHFGRFNTKKMNELSKLIN